jgi:hypothetical protein
MPSLNIILNRLDPAQGWLDRFIGHFWDLFETMGVLVFNRFDNLGDRPKTRLQLMHQSFLSVHLRLIILLLVLPQKWESLFKPLSDILFGFESKFDFIFDFLV